MAGLESATYRGAMNTILPLSSSSAGRARTSMPSAPLEPSAPSTPASAASEARGAAPQRGAVDLRVGARLSSSMRSQRLQLPRDGGAVSLRVRRPTRIEAEQGRAWVTRVGAHEDFWLDAGQGLDFSPKARWRGVTLVISGEDASGPVTLKVEALG